MVKSSTKILFIEDDKKKIEDMINHLRDEYSYENLVVKESFQTGLRELLNKKYDLLLLDMSLPMWDHEKTSSAVSFKKFGGYMILNEIIRKKKPVKTIVVTMFDDFGESDNSLSLNELDKHLKEDFGEYYLGSVFYSSKANVWKQDFDKIFKSFT